MTQQIDRLPEGEQVDQVRLRRIIDQLRSNIFELEALNILTTKGDLLSRDDTTYGRLPVGTDGQILSADSGETLGLKWIDNTGGGGGPPDPNFPLDGLLAWWPLDEASGNRVDRRNGFTLTEFGGTVSSMAPNAATAPFGGAPAANNPTGYALAALFTAGTGTFLKSVNTTLNVTATTGFSVAIWARFLSLPASTNARSLVNRWETANVNNWSWNLTSQNDLGNPPLPNGDAVRFYSSPNGFSANQATTTQPSSNTWNLFVGTFTPEVAGSVTITVNIDGSQATGSTTNVKITSLPMLVGGLTGSNNATMDGLLGPLGVWNRPLTSTEITNLVNGAVYNAP